MTQPHPHDHLIRAVFSSPENAMGILRALLPLAALAELDPTSLALQEGTFIDESLRGQESDLLFKGRLAGSETRIYVLVEHQSRVDPLMPLRLLRYVVRIWERIIRESEPAPHLLPAVIPLVLFHGARPWHGPRRLADIVDLPPHVAAALGPHVPGFELLIDDLAVLAQTAVVERRAGLLGRLALVFLKAASEGTDFLELWTRSKPLLEQLVTLPGGRDGLILLVSYTLSVRQIPVRTLADHIRQLLSSTVGGDVVASTYEQILAEGRIEGVRMSLARLLEKKFGAIPGSLRDRIQAASLPELEVWTDRVLVATRLDDVFAASS